MPIYEYRCEKCGHKFELLRRMSDSDDEVRCEICGHQKVEKQFSAFAASGGSAAESHCACGNTSGYS